MIAQIIKPDSSTQKVKHENTVFLAGSIEMGLAEDWQKLAEEALQDSAVTIFNPRRNDWDSNWEQRAHNPQFSHQVNWEMDRLKEAGHVLMHLAPGTKSPISLLELGLHAADGKLLIVCPDGFWRKGNVEIVCQRYGIWMYESLSDALADLTDMLT